MNKQPVIYYQTDKRWSGKDYSAKGESTTIGKSGCGPACMAMVIATWADPSVTPVETCAWALAHGYKAVNQGTYYSYFKPQGAVYGIQAEQLNWNNLRNVSAAAAAPYHEKAAQAVKNGDLVICCMGPGLWTSGGHFILLWDIQGDTAYINDPASSRTERTRGSLARLRKEVKYYFICKKPAAPEKKEDDGLTEEQVRKIAREEFAALEAERAKLPASDWAVKELEQAKAAGITDGTRPRSYATREEAAIMVKRAREG